MRQIILVLAMLMAWAFPQDGRGGLKDTTAQLSAWLNAAPQRPGESVKLEVWPVFCLPGSVDTAPAGPDAGTDA